MVFECGITQSRHPVAVLLIPEGGLYPPAAAIDIHDLLDGGVLQVCYKVSRLFGIGVE
jgi:hypothetical protein